MLSSTRFYREGKTMEKPIVKEAQKRIALISGHKKLNERFSSVEEENEVVEKFCILMNQEIDPGDVLHCIKNSDYNFTIQLEDGTQFTYDPIKNSLC